LCVVPEDCERHPALLGPRAAVEQGTVDRPDDLGPSIMVPVSDWSEGDLERRTEGHAMAVISPQAQLRLQSEAKLKLAVLDVIDSEFIGTPLGRADRALLLKGILRDFASGQEHPGSATRAMQKHLALHPDITRSPRLLSTNVVELLADIRGGCEPFPPVLDRGPDKLRRARSAPTLLTPCREPYLSATRLDGSIRGSVLVRDLLLRAV